MATNSAYRGVRKSGGGRDLDIHKPKPWQGWREFLKEYAIVVIGVLTALAGEQAVEALHWRHEVADTREALSTELSNTLGVLQLISAQDRCIDVRLNLLKSWAEGQAHLNKPHLAAASNRPRLYALKTTVWDLVKASQVASHMSLPERDRYAVLYEGLLNQTGNILREREAWVSLARYDGLARLDGANAKRLSDDVAEARARALSRRSNTPTLLDWGRQLGVSPARHPPVPGADLGPDLLLSAAELIARRQRSAIRCAQAFSEPGSRSTARRKAFFVVAQSLGCLRQTHS